jgi:hypothetical protein
MRAKFINEKFSEDSDPIRDMGIGTRPLLNKEWAKLLQMTTNEIYNEYFLKIKFDRYQISTNIVASFYFNLIKRLKEDYWGDYQRDFDEEVSVFKRAVHYTEDLDGLYAIIKEAAMIIKRKFGIKVKYR